jgi:hypothetical protein
MSLIMKITTRQVVFSFEDDDMTASWRLTSDMGESQIMAKILAMVKFLQQQPQSGQLIPLPVRLVEPSAIDDYNVMDMRAEYDSRLNFDHQGEAPPAISWPPARPVPAMSDLVARLPSSFEMIPPGDDEFDPA